MTENERIIALIAGKIAATLLLKNGLTHEETARIAVEIARDIALKVRS